jgi:hypothetical protein
LSDFRHIQITQLHGPIPVEENVCTLQVSVEDIFIMQGLETSDHLANTLPNLPLRECTASFLMLENPLIQIAPIRKFHDYAQSLRDFIIEGLLVPNHVLMSKH